MFHSANLDEENHRKKWGRRSLIDCNRPRLALPSALLLRGKFEFNDGETSYTRGAKRMLAAPLKTGVSPSPRLAPPMTRGLSCQRRNPAPTLGGIKELTTYFITLAAFHHILVSCVRFTFVPFGMVCIIGVLLG